MVLLTTLIIQTMMCSAGLHVTHQMLPRKSPYACFSRTQDLTKTAAGHMLLHRVHCLLLGCWLANFELSSHICTPRDQHILLCFALINIPDAMQSEGHAVQEADGAAIGSSPWTTAGGEASRRGETHANFVRFLLPTSFFWALMAPSRAWLMSKEGSQPRLCDPADVPLLPCRFCW